MYLFTFYWLHYCQHYNYFCPFNLFSEVTKKCIHLSISLLPWWADAGEENLLGGAILPPHNKGITVHHLHNFASELLILVCQLKTPKKNISATPTAMLVTPCFCLLPEGRERGQLG